MSTISHLASSLLQLTAQTQPASPSNGSGADSIADALRQADSGGASDALADSLNLSNASIADLEQQAQQVASQNRSSALANREDAFAANLAAVAALSANPAQAKAAQGGQDAASVLGLVGL